MYSNNKKFFATIVSIAFVFSLITFGNAQEASAEFISSMIPAKLKSGEQATDGIKNIFYQNQKLYVTNIWTGLQVLDVSDLRKPVEVGRYMMEERTHNCFLVHIDVQEIKLPRRLIRFVNNRLYRFNNLLITCTSA